MIRKFSLLSLSLSPQKNALPRHETTTDAVAGQQTPRHVHLAHQQTLHHHTFKPGKPTASPNPKPNSRANPLRRHAARPRQYPTLAQPASFILHLDSPRWIFTRPGHIHQHSEERRGEARSAAECGCECGVGESEACVVAVDLVFVLCGWGECVDLVVVAVVEELYLVDQ